MKGEMNLITFEILMSFDRKKKNVHYGVETLSYQSLKLWSLLPKNVKEVESLELFKRKVNI